MNSSSRIGRAISSLPDLRTLPFLAALCALEACSMWQSWHGATRPVAEVPAATGLPAVAQTEAAPPADPSTNGGADGAAAAQPPAGTEAAPAHSAGAAKPRPEPAVSRITRQPSAGGGSEGLSSDDVGYYMDVLQAQLTQAVGRDARIERRGSSIVLVLPLGFDVDSARLDSAGRQSVRRLAEILSEYRLTIVSVQVSGPDSDPQGSSARLASDRVAALSKYLTRAGVAGKRISTVGEGSNLLQADSAPAPGFGVRAELQVSPIVVGASN
jgi:outer membrane protein OmpA-like peptidoglycan-associated protein